MNEEARKLLEEVETALAGERAAVARTLGILIEADERRSYREEGFTSLYELCTKKLGFEPEEASCRIALASIAKMHPPVRDALVNDRLSAADWKKPLGQMSPGKAVARVFVQLWSEVSYADMALDDEDEDEDEVDARSPALTIISGGKESPTIGSARRLRP